MALTKRNYVDNQTIITAQNLNNIQDEIIQNTELIKKVAPRNLLDNSDFKNPVNQLGIMNGMVVKPYAGFIDRWRNGEGSSIAPNLSSNGIQSNGAIFQILDLSAYIGKKMTLAAGFSNGNVVIASGTLTEASTNQEPSAIFSTMDGTNGIGIGSMNGIWMAAINYPNSIIQWAALYEGEYTAETLPEYQPKGYANELLVCRQYDPSTDEYIGLSKFSPTRNLLDNSDFRNPVNQRGFVSGTIGSASYTIDRWILQYDTYLHLHTGYVGISGKWDIKQLVGCKMFAGKTYTFSVEAKSEADNGNMFMRLGDPAGTGACEHRQAVNSNSWSKCVSTWTADRDYEPGECVFAFGINTGNELSTQIYYKNLAVYEGKFTAETLPEYQPKGYAAELAECQRYYREYEAIALAPFVYDGTLKRHYRLNFDTPMRVAPTVDVSQLLEKQLWQTISSSFDIYRTDMHGIVFATISDIVSQSNCYVEGKLYISADL